MTNWTSLGTPPLGIDENNGDAYFPVATNSDGRLEVCALDSNGALWHIWQVAPAGAWSNWNALSNATLSKLYSPAAIGKNSDGRLEVFAFGLSELMHIWQVSPGGGWSAWTSLAGPNLVYPVVVVNGDGRMEIFASGNAPSHIWQLTPGGAWSNWDSFVIPTGQSPGFYFNRGVGVGRNVDGRIELFSSDRYGALWHTWQVSAGGGWSNWSSFGTLPVVFGNLSSPTVAANGDGRLEVFVGAGVDGAIWHRWQLSPGGRWSAWASLGVPTGTLQQPNTYIPCPNVAVNADGRLEIFATASDGALWHIWQVSPRIGWSSWSSLGTPSGVAAFDRTSSVGVNGDGRLEVFARSSDGSLWHTWQEGVAGGAWG